MFKLIRLLKRKPGSSVAAFQERWRMGHGPYLAKLSGLRRCVQSHALPQGYAKGELLFDGLEELWFDSRAAFEACLASPEWQAASRDSDAFLDVARTVTMPVAVHVIKDGPIPANAVKNVEFVNRRPGMELEPFRRYWREVHGPLAARIAVLKRYEQNHLCLEAYANTAAPAYDGLAITWFASTADMKLGATTPEYAATRADEPHFLPDGHLPIIITREHVIVGP
jgi:uncharacterized protein (TIGR02118 family)